jgi:hypothetical protein
MNAFLRKFLSVSALAFIAVSSIGSVHGQAAKAVIEKPMFDDLPSPEFPGGKSKPFKAKDWLEIEIKLNLLLSPEPISKTCDKVIVKWYVAVKNPEKPGTFLKITKAIEYVNVPLSEDVYCSVYLSPSSIKRLTGYDRAGKKVAQETSKGKVGWWNAPSDKISDTDLVPLLNKAETPFAPMWWDRYAEVSAERR